MKSIQTKLTVTIIVIFLISLGLLSGLNYWEARKIVSENVEKEIGTLTQSLADNMSGWLNNRKNEIIITSLNSQILSGNKEAIIPFVASVKKSSLFYDTISYASLDGNYVNNLGVASNVSDRVYFQKALKGEINVSSPVVSKSTGNLISPVAVPVKVDNKITGVVWGSVELKFLTEQILSGKIGKTGYAFVIQSDGLTIIHPDKERAMKDRALENPDIPDGLKQIFSKAIKGEQGLATTTFGGKERYYCYRPVQGTDWTVIIGVPVEEMTEVVGALTQTSLIIGFFVLLVAGVVITLFARNLTIPIRKLEAEAQNIANGDISTSRLRIMSNDEIGRLGQSFELMKNNLRNLIQKILSTSEQIAASSGELTAQSGQSAQAVNSVATSMNQVANDTERQLDAVNSAANVVESMTSGIRQVADNANAVADASEKTSAMAKTGEQSVETAVNQMSTIEKTVNHSATVVSKLGERSQEIGQIVDTISGIAGQTNLLALNAAIEAARAGEQGRGFAVVADEVRKLAEQSQDAAKRIAVLIQETQTETSEAVSAMQKGMEEVKIGTQVVNSTGDTFKEIVSLIEQMSGQVKNISNSIHSLSGYSLQMSQVAQDIIQLSKNTAGQAQSVSAATEETSSSMDEITNASEALAGLSIELQNAVHKFKL